MISFPIHAMLCKEVGEDRIKNRLESRMCKRGLMSASSSFCYRHSTFVARLLRFHRSSLPFLPASSPSAVVFRSPQFPARPTICSWVSEDASWKNCINEWENICPCSLPGTHPCICCLLLGSSRSDDGGIAGKVVSGIWFKQGIVPYQIQVGHSSKTFRTFVKPLKCLSGVQLPRWCRSLGLTSRGPQTKLKRRARLKATEQQSDHSSRPCLACTASELNTGICRCLVWMRQRSQSPESLGKHFSGNRKLSGAWKKSLYPLGNVLHIGWSCFHMVPL